MWPFWVALGARDAVAIVYGTSRGSSVWQVYSRTGRVVAEGWSALQVQPAAGGFYLRGDGITDEFVAAAGRVTQVNGDGDPTGQGYLAGDMWVPEVGMFRRSTMGIYPTPRPRVGTAVQGQACGALWSMSSGPRRQTVVRTLRPGGRWRARTLGPGLAGSGLVASGTIIVIGGKRQAYLSPDCGRTWHLASHHAGAYYGGPPVQILPDGSVLAGDDRGTWAMSRDYRSFFTPAVAGFDNMMGGALFERAQGRKHIEVSLDLVHWLPFSPGSVRQLLAARSQGPVHP